MHTEVIKFVSFKIAYDVYKTKSSSKIINIIINHQ